MVPFYLSLRNSVADRNVMKTSTNINMERSQSMITYKKIGKNIISIGLVLVLSISAEMISAVETKAT